MSDGAAWIRRRRRCRSPLTAVRTSTPAVLPVDGQLRPDCQRIGQNVGRTLPATDARVDGASCRKNLFEPQRISRRRKSGPVTPRRVKRLLEVSPSDFPIRGFRSATGGSMIRSRKPVNRKKTWCGVGQLDFRGSNSTAFTPVFDPPPPSDGRTPHPVFPAYFAVFCAEGGT